MCIYLLYINVFLSFTLYLLILSTAPLPSVLLNPRKDLQTVVCTCYQGFTIMDPCQALFYSKMERLVRITEGTDPFAQTSF